MAEAAGAMAETEGSRDPSNPVEAARLAALSRSLGIAVTPSGEQKELKEQRLKFLDIIDNQFLGTAFKRENALAALDLLKTLLANALADPSKRTIRMTNSAFKRRVIDASLLEGPFTLYLVETGWKHEVQNFEPKRIFPAEPRPEVLQKLTVGEEVLRGRMSMIQESHDKHKEAVAANKQAEEARGQTAKRWIEDDRQKVQARAEREKAARDRAKALEEAGEPPAYKP